MLHLSPLYRFLTVLYVVFGFGRIFLRFWKIFFFGFAVYNIPQYPPPLAVVANQGYSENGYNCSDGCLRSFI